MFANFFMHPSNFEIIFRGIWRFLPLSATQLVRYIPYGGFLHLRKLVQLINKTAEQLVKEKSDAVLAGDNTRKDIMSVLGQSEFSGLDIH